MTADGTAFDRLVARLTPLGELRLRGNHADARCPAHEDRNPSLSIDRGDDRVLVKCPAGCTIEQVVAAINWTMADLFDDPRQAGGDDDWTPLAREGGRLVATYRYVDESGRLLHATARIVMPDGSKRFRQWQPDPSEPRGRRWNLKGAPRVLYRLPGVIAAVNAGQVIYVVEGEKDVHAVERAGGVATCNPMGAGKWRHEYAEPLRGAEVVVVADHDEPGIAHAGQVAESLAGLAASVRLVQAAEGKDAADHLAAGHGLDDFVPLDDDAGDGDRQLEVVSSPNHPLPNAHRFIASHYTRDEAVVLLYCRNAFYGWTGSLWQEVEAADLRAALYDRFENTVYLKPEKVKGTPFEPNRRSVAYLVEALQAATFKPQTLSAPGWIDTAGIGPADEIVACENGLLHVPTRKLYAHTPAFFNHHCVPFAYDSHAPTPERWLRFLKDLWRDDEQSIATLQEVFGYLISGDTRQQKMFLIVGPKRAGKGTIARVAKRLIGPHHVAGSTLASLGTNFGLEPLVNAAVTFISDARLPRGDSSIIAERLLSISGEDPLTVDRKYRAHWTGKLPTRIVMLTNELPRMSDTSGALASRFIVLTLTRSFYGEENPALSDELYSESPGILNWALVGLDRLLERGRFIQPESSEQAIRDMEDLASPVGAFLRDCCDIGLRYEVSVDELYAAWKRWCEDQGRDHPGTKQTLGRDLRAALPALKVIRPRESEPLRHRTYQGLRLKSGTHNGEDRGPSWTTDGATTDGDEQTTARPHGPGSGARGPQWSADSANVGPTHEHAARGEPNPRPPGFGPEEGHFEAWSHDPTGGPCVTCGHPTNGRDPAGDLRHKLGCPL